jgi:hypothetical protein
MTTELKSEIGKIHKTWRKGAFTVSQWIDHNYPKLGVINPYLSKPSAISATLIFNLYKAFSLYISCLDI